jgi:hypothetical protein
MIINQFAETLLMTGMFLIHVRPLLIHPFGGTYINVKEYEERGKVRMREFADWYGGPVLNYFSN